MRDDFGTRPWRLTRSPVMPGAATMLPRWPPGWPLPVSCSTWTSSLRGHDATQGPGKPSSHAITRRHFFEQCGLGLGKTALTASSWRFAVRIGNQRARNRKAARRTQGQERHLPVHGRRPEPVRVVGAQTRSAEVERPTHPPSWMQGKRFAFMESFAKDPPRLLGVNRTFKRYGQSGAGCPTASRTPPVSSTTFPSSNRSTPTTSTTRRPR